MATERVLVVLVLAALLVWPALWNGYPIVFADTGTYLSQAIHRYLGWDRPAFYSLFMLPLHMTLTPWPVVVAQALLTGWVLSVLWQVLAPARRPRGLVPLGLVLSIGTWLPWLVSELMPDIFTSLIVLVFGLLALTPSRLGLWERRCLTAFAAFMIAAQLSNVALWTALTLGFMVILIIRGTWLGRGSGAWSCVVSAGTTLLPPLALALLAMSTLNLAGHGRFSPSPFGNVFQLARLLADGPAADVLRTRCPDAGWRLCAVTDRLPSDSDIFLWEPDSPILDVGGHKAVSAEAGAIIVATLRAFPGAVARDALRNTLTQLTRMRSGDGLEPWPRQVTPWIERDFPPPSIRAYHAARQQAGALQVPGWIDAAHLSLAVGGMAAALPLALWVWRRSRAHAGFLLLSLVALPLAAAITGALSMPHDRYQARVAFLPALLCLVSVPGLARLPHPVGRIAPAVDRHQVTARRHA